MTETIDTQDPLAVAVAEAIRGGDVPGLKRLLDEHPGLATARLGDDDRMSRTLLHVATDWPGHVGGTSRFLRDPLQCAGGISRFPQTPSTVASRYARRRQCFALVERGARTAGESLV